MEIAIKIAGKVESSFKNALSVASKGISGIGKMAGIAAKASIASAAAVGGMAAAAVNVGKEFEGAMSQVTATMLIDKDTKKGSKQFTILEEAARKCGASTAFSATEAAEALNNLAMAGYGATEAATALPTVLNLAGAGGLQLADSARYLTAGLASLNIKKTEGNFNHFADILAITASKAKTDVAQMGDAITTLGGTGKGLKGGTEEIAAALGILADADITASEGGTHLRNMIMSLQKARNSDAGKMFKDLGISAYDSQGKMRGLNEIFKDLNTSMEGMSDQQKNDIMSTIFKQTDLAAAKALLADCGDRFDELYEAAKKSSKGTGAAAKMYEKQMDNLQGDIDILKSSLSDLGISFYKDIGGPIRGVTQAASDMVTQLNNAYKSGGLSAMLSETGDVMAQVVNGIATYAPAIVDTGIELTQNLVNGITQNSAGIASAAGNVLTTFATVVFSLAPQIALTGMDIMLQLSQSLTAQAPQLINSGVQAITGFIDGFVTRIPAITSTSLSLIQTIANGVIQNAPQLAGAGLQLIGGLFTGMMGMLPQLTQIGVQLMDNLAQGIQGALPGLIPVAMQALVSFSGTLRANAGSIVDAGINLIMTLAQSFISGIPTFIQTVPIIITNIAGIINDNAPKLLSAGMQLVVQLLSGIIQSVPVLISNIPQIIQAVVSVFTAFNWMALGSNVVTFIGNGIRTAITNIPQIFSNFVQTAHNIVNSSGWHSLGSKIITTMGNGIKSMITSIPQLFSNIGTFAVQAIKNIDWWAVGTSIIQLIGQAISGAGGFIIDAVKGIGGSIVDGIKGIFGGGDDKEAEESGKSTATSYASGIQAGAANIAGAASSAGLAGATAFNNSMASNMNMPDISSIMPTAPLAANVDTSSITQSMASAGLEGGTAFTTSLNNSINANTFDISNIGIDTSVLTTNMETAGQAGATAIGNGFANNTQAVTTAATGMADGVNAALDSGWQKAISSANSSMNSLVTTVTTKAQTAANAVKSAFSNMVITIPKPKIPVISTTYKTESYGDGGNVKLPQFSVNWNAKGGIFDRPTIFNTRSGMQGVGEAGSEAILPLDMLWQRMQAIISQSIKEKNTSLFDTLSEKLSGIAKEKSSRKAPALQTAGGGTMQFYHNPTYNFYGNTSKKDIQEADRGSYADFCRYMKKWQKDQGRTRF